MMKKSTFFFIEVSDQYVILWSSRMIKKKVMYKL